MLHQPTALAIHTFCTPRGVVVWIEELWGDTLLDRLWRP
jgi:hypothetical protein